MVEWQALYCIFNVRLGRVRLVLKTAAYSLSDALRLPEPIPGFVSVTLQDLVSKDDLASPGEVLCREIWMDCDNICAIKLARLSTPFCSVLTDMQCCCQGLRLELTAYWCFQSNFQLFHILACLLLVKLSVHPAPQVFDWRQVRRIDRK